MEAHYTQNMSVGTINILQNYVYSKNMAKIKS